MSKDLWLYPLTFLTMLLIAMGGLWLSYSIPSQWLEKNTALSLATFEAEGIYPSYGFRPRKIVLDNFTDSLMISTAFSAVDNSPHSLFFNDRYVVSTQEANQLINLRAALEHTAPLTASYERYWHGYLVFLRPLLVILNYQGIRFLLHIFLIGMFGYLVYLFCRRGELLKSIALIGAALATDFLYVGQSLQFSSVFAIGIVASLWFVLKRDKAVNVPWLFFVTGMVTSYFDLLTAPLVTLGLLLIVTTDEKSFLAFFKNTVAWSLGYSLFWVSKWLLVETFFYKGAMNGALGHVLNRTVNQADQQFSHIQTLILNISQLIGYDKMSKIICLGLALMLILLLVIYKKRHIQLQKTLYWVVMATVPYAWYLVAANHSYLHVWFTYRAQFVTVAAGLMAYFTLIDWTKVKLLLKKTSYRRRHR